MLNKEVQEKIRETLIEALQKYFKDTLPAVVLPEQIDLRLQPAKDKVHGDITTNVAMTLASCAKTSPMKLSEGIVGVFNGLCGGSDISRYIGKAESKGGFINLWFSKGYYGTILDDIFKKNKDFGRNDTGGGKRVNIEFVSANPTGPLTIAHGRQAAIGDALANILEFNDFQVTREYYLNDFGRQIKLLGRSVEVRYRNLFSEISEEMPEDGYQGSYIIDIAKEIKEKKNGSLMEQSEDVTTFFREYAVEYMMELIRKDLSDFSVSFDVWTSQAGIEDRDEVETVLDELKNNGYVYEKDGAVWFASTNFDDDKDRVVVKSDGSFTYLAPDIAYHKNKYERGYDKLIDLLGPDHHGYIKRMKAAIQALGKEKEALDILIVQLVTLMRNGETVSMSTRKGEFISLREIIDEIGTDVTRFFFLTRRLDSHLDFDIEVAKKESSDNPVYYIQYAHARICSILRFNEERDDPLSSDGADTALLENDAEKELIRKLSDFPLAVSTSAESLEPSRLITYLNELAREFHSFYTECRVVTDDTERTRARLFLVQCVRTVLSNGLGLLNISLPERM